MREILFQGKRIDNCEWIVGHLISLEDGRARINESHTDIFCYLKDSSIIQTVAHEVYPETVGQFVGLTDKNGKKIFEGDILSEQGYLFVVIYDTKWAKFKLQHISRCIQHPEWNRGEQMEIVGNIHDNPELPEVEDGK